MFNNITKSLLSSSILRRSMSSTSKASGKVKFFDATKGFGFIVPDAGGDDVFVHQTAVHAQGFRSLAEGESVEYELTHDQARNKYVATKVTGPGGTFVQGSERREAPIRGKRTPGVYDPNSFRKY